MNQKKTESGIVNISGKDYKTVALRIHEFRTDHPDWTILVKIITNNENRVVIECQIKDGQRLIGMGHAEEFREATGVNLTSALENCETSAIGRALACVGYGGMQYASADEVQAAIQKQESGTAVRPQREHFERQQAQGGNVPTAEGFREASKSMGSPYDQDPAPAEEPSSFKTQALELIRQWSGLHNDEQAIRATLNAAKIRKPKTGKLSANQWQKVYNFVKGNMHDDFFDLVDYPQPVMPHQPAAQPDPDASEYDQGALDDLLYETVEGGA